MKVRISQETYSFNLATDPNRGMFTSGTGKITRSGSLVTMSLSAIAFPSMDAPYSAAFIPAHLRPIGATSVIISNLNGHSWRLVVYTDGAMQFSIKDHLGNPQVKTSSLIATTVSWALS